MKLDKGGDSEELSRGTCWFDYRGMNEVQRDKLFRDMYAQLYAEFYAKCKDAEEVLDCQLGVIEEREITKARQAADLIGCRYDFYIRFAFGRAFDRGMSSFPKPSRMHSEELVLDARDAWRAWLQISLDLAKNERFLNQNYEGHPDQDNYHLYLVDMIKSRGHPEITLHRVMNREQVLPENIARKYLSCDVVDKALALDKFITV